MRKAQASLDYLLLIGAAVLFTILVTIPTQNLSLQQGQAINTKAADIAATARAGISIAPGLELPSIPAASVVAPECNPGDACINATTYCVYDVAELWDPCSGMPLNSGCSDTPISLECTDYSCDIYGKCTVHEKTGCSPCARHVSSNFTCGSGYVPWPLGGQCYRRQWVLCDPNGVSCSSDYPDEPDCAAFCVQRPSCTVYVDITSGVGPFTVTGNVTFHNAVPGMNLANITCNDTDPGFSIPINPPENTTGNFNCLFPAVPSTQAFTITAADSGPWPGGYSVCNVEITDEPSSAPLDCTITETPESGRGPFGSIIVVRFDNLPPGATTTNISCSAGGNEVEVPINLTTKEATLICEYPQNLGSVIDWKSIIADVNGEGCEGTVANKPQPSCSYLTCQLGAKNFFDFIIRPAYQAAQGYNPPQIMMYNSTDVCDFVSSKCETSPPCRLRGTRLDDDVCINAEDWVDYDLNDVKIKSYVVDYPSGDRLMQVTDLVCETAAADNLTINFDFSPSAKVVTRLSDGQQKSGTFVNFSVWSDCHAFLKGTEYFFISSGAPANTPPIWETISTPAPKYPTQAVPSIDLYPMVSDLQSGDAMLTLNITYQSNRSVVNCNISDNRNLVCGNALIYGRNLVIVRATDPEGLWSERTIEYVIGPVFEPPTGTSRQIGGSVTQGLAFFTNDPKFSETVPPLTYSVVSQSNTSIANCNIWLDAFNNAYLSCPVVSNIGSSDVVIRVQNPDGARAEATHTVTGYVLT